MNKLYWTYLEPLGLTYPQLLVMVVLKTRSNLRVSDFCDYLHLDSGTVTPLLKRLEKKGLLERTRSKEDERSVTVSLTSEGKKFTKQFDSLADNLFSDLGVSMTEMTDLVKKLRRLRDNIDRNILERIGNVGEVQQKGY